MTVREARLHLRARLERVLEPHRDMDRVLEFSWEKDCCAGWRTVRESSNLIFLDMEMGQLDGMETARRLRQIEESLPLVFVTGYTEHVFEGYTGGALGYLLKPVREDQLKEVLSRAAAALLREEEEVYLCRRGDVTYRIPRKKILYFTSDRRQVTCVTTEKHYTFYGKLDQVEEELKDSFVRNSSAVSGADTGGTADLGQPSLSGWADTAHQPVLSTGCDDCPHPGLAGGVTMDGLDIAPTSIDLSHLWRHTGMQAAVGSLWNGPATRNGSGLVRMGKGHPFPDVWYLHRHGDLGWRS